MILLHRAMLIVMRSLFVARLGRIINIMFFYFVTSQCGFFILVAVVTSHKAIHVSGIRYYCKSLIVHANSYMYINVWASDIKFYLSVYLFYWCIDIRERTIVMCYCKK